MANELLASRISKAIIRNNALLITAGAGMGVDSGLPNFRGKEGLWKEYPYFKKVNMSFTDAANPYFFSSKPNKFWFFYGHRYNIYKEKQPHEGFRVLLDICNNLKDKKYHVYTSNVDGHFQKAGFDEKKITEVHGSINHFQWDSCRIIYPVPEETKFDLDTDNFEWPEIPHCKSCKRPVRPNILMFSDYDWISDRTDSQETHFRNFLSNYEKEGITILEFGAGVGVPTIRMAGESVFWDSHRRRTFVRINPEPGNVSQYRMSYDTINDSNVHTVKESNDNEFIELRLSALSAIELISKALKSISQN